VSLIALFPTRQVKIGCFLLVFEAPFSYGPCGAATQPGMWRRENVREKVECHFGAAKRQPGSRGTFTTPHFDQPHDTFFGVKKYRSLPDKRFQRYGFHFCNRLAYEPSTVIACMHSYVGVTEITKFCPGLSRHLTQQKAASNRKACLEGFQIARPSLSVLRVDVS
jgi:hypothetical protein